MFDRFDFCGVSPLEGQQVCHAIQGLSQYHCVSHSPNQSDTDGCDFLLYSVVLLGQHYFQRETGLDVCAEHYFAWYQSHSHHGGVWLQEQQIREAPTSLDKNDEQGRDVELGSVHPENEDDIVYHHNPMIQQSHSEDTVPLLQRVDNVEHRTESIEAETKSVRLRPKALRLRPKALRLRPKALRLNEGRAYGEKICKGRLWRK